MFVDYYAVLEIEITATSEEIKAAFKKQALKWHPDKNQGKDTTARMQVINEAKVLLLDTEAREKYNKEYSLFKEEQKQKAYQQREKEYQQPTSSDKEEKTYEYNYSVHDEVLKRWMDNAKRQAVDLTRQTIEDFRGMVAAGAKAAVKEGSNALMYQLIIGAVFIVIFGLAKSCNQNNSVSVKKNLQTYSTVDTIQIDTSYHTIAFKKFSIKDVGFISIAQNMKCKAVIIKIK